MKEIGHWILYWILRGALALRYRVRIEDKDLLHRIPNKGILILPNHPAEVDSLILMRVLWPRFRPRPLAVEHFYYQKGIRFFMDLVRTLPLPTMDTGNPWKIQQIQKLKKRILGGFKTGDNFLIYPSGRLKSTGEEQVGGTSMVHDLLQEMPQLPMVLIRISGLWGSRFSRALTGSTPDFGKMLWESVKLLVKNGIFFAPRREVQVTVKWLGEEFPRKASKLEINRAFGQWYNRDGIEPIKLVSNVFWKEELPKVIVEQPKEIEKKAIPKEIEQEVIRELVKISRYPMEKIQPELSLSNDLGLDSLDLAGLYLLMEERYGFQSVPGELRTVQDLLETAAGKAAAKPIEPDKFKKRSKWPKEFSRLAIEMPKGETLPEVFLRSCNRMGNAIACADRLTSPRSYRKLKRRVLVLSLQIAALKGEKIGILLPASVATYVVIFATLLAKKVPVMLNWTSGMRNLEHAASLCNLQAVISSYRFLSRLDTVNVGQVDDILVLLEEMRRGVSLKMKLQGMLLSFCSVKTLLNRCRVNPEDPAVIIFTSGTETLPKGVPLTHRNLLTNLRSALSCVNLQSNDLVYSVLPPFHSFGFSVTGILPLLIGMKVCYSPDPTDSHAMANDVEHWRPTLFCCAPSFIQGLFQVAVKEQLETLRLIVTGAEKAPQALFTTAEKLGKRVIEGYGISECSPIVTLQREGEERRGVGKPIPGIQLTIEEGEVWISGESVFGGYLGDVPSPFAEKEGKRWYKSGDLGQLEADGTLILTGRKKRFIKVGGEMISLGGIEEELSQLAPKSDKPQLAVIAIEKESEKPEIIVFTTFDLNREQASQYLKERGHGRLVKISEVRKIQEIPLTGTGKTHYRLLDEMANQK